MSTSLSAAVVAAMLLASCSSGESRGDVLADLADDGAAPAYSGFLSEATSLQNAVDLLCSDPDEQGAKATQESLGVARGSWLDTEAMWVGPVMDRRSWTLIDWPIDPEEIESLIADESVEIDAELLGRRVGADQRGLGAIEYLLGATPTEAVAAANDERRCDYLVAASTVIVDEATQVEAAWVDGIDGQEPYAETFADDESTSLDALVNDGLIILEDMADAELGAALGEMDGEGDLDAIVEGPGGYGVSDLQHRLDGLEVVFVGGGDQAGLSPLFDEELEQLLIDQFDAASEAISALESPLRDAVIETPDDVHEVYEALEELIVTVSTEVASELGVSVGVSDADGDSSG